MPTQEPEMDPRNAEVGAVDVALRPGSIAPAAGDLVRLRVGSRPAPSGARVVAWDDAVGTVNVDGDIPRTGDDVSVRWLDGEGEAWECQAVAGPGPDGTVSLRLVDGWQPVPARRAVRIPTPRRRVRCELPGVCADLVSLDVSMRGCRASGIGAPPTVGDAVKLAAESGTYERPRWISAHVVRVVQHPFRRFEVGFEFDIETDEEFEAVTDWRDLALRER